MPGHLTFSDQMQTLSNSCYSRKFASHDVRAVRVWLYRRIFENSTPAWWSVERIRRQNVDETSPEHSVSRPHIGVSCWFHTHFAEYNNVIFCQVHMEPRILCLHNNTYTLCLKNVVSNFFAITSSTVNRFWNSFTIGNSNKLSIKWI